MEKKEAFRHHDSFWSFFGARYDYKSFLLRFFSKSSNAKTFLTKGFTLVELLIVIGILSILSVGAITVLNPTSQFQKANDVRRKSDLNQVQKALEVYYGDNGKYPPNYSVSDYRIKGLDGNVVNWGSSWQPYMEVLPKDPKGSKNYVYFASSDGQSYFLYASLDRGTDSSTCNGGAACNSLTTNGIPAVACGDTCNFGLSSPNVSP